MDIFSYSAEYQFENVDDALGFIDELIEAFNLPFEEEDGSQVNLDTLNGFMLARAHRKYTRKDHSSFFLLVGEYADNVWKTQRKGSYTLRYYAPYIERGSSRTPLVYFTERPLSVHNIIALFFMAATDPYCCYVPRVISCLANVRNSGCIVEIGVKVSCEGREDTFTLQLIKNHRITVTPAKWDNFISRITGSITKTLTIPPHLSLADAMEFADRLIAEYNLPFRRAEAGNIVVWIAPGTEVRSEALYRDLSGEEGRKSYGGILIGRARSFWGEIPVVAKYASFVDNEILRTRVATLPVLAGYFLTEAIPPLLDGMGARISSTIRLTAADKFGLSKHWQYFVDSDENCKELYLLKEGDVVLLLPLIQNDELPSLQRWREIVNTIRAVVFYENL